MITIKTLLEHIQTGDPTTFPAVLEAYLQTSGANLDTVSPVQINNKTYILTPLMMAARMGQTDTVDLLLKRGANINHRCYSDKRVCHTALIQAVRSGSISTVTLLLERGAEVNSKQSCLYTALVSAVELRDITIVALLLKHGANMNAHAFSTSSAFAKSVKIWDPSPTLAQLALTEFLVKEGAACSRHDFFEIFYDVHSPRLSPTVFTNQRSLIYQIFEKAQRLVPDFAFNDEWAIKIERIQHNNKVSKIGKICGFELARQTPLNGDLSNIVNDYLFVGECHKILTYEFNRARANPSLTRCSEDEITPSRCSIS